MFIDNTIKFCNPCMSALVNANNPSLGTRRDFIRRMDPPENLLFIMQCIVLMESLKEDKGCAECTAAFIKDLNDVGLLGLFKKVYRDKAL